MSSTWPPALDSTSRFRNLPRSRRLRIGLLGGSFDPPHSAHLAISRTALARLRLDQVWWLVSPRNPLKGAPTANLKQRLNLAQHIASHPRVLPTAVEVASSTTFTRDTLRWIVRRAPTCRFVWLMGADNLRNFHRWRAWREIARIVPIAVFDRPEATFSASQSPAALALRTRRTREPSAATLASRRPPAWVFLHTKRLAVSSTALRTSARLEKP